MVNIIGFVIFSETRNLNLNENLRLATTNQLFQPNSRLYELIDGVAMGSPLGSLLANTFMCCVKENL